MRFALLPSKPLALAKTRLAPDLRDSERQAVSLAMFHDVLESLCRAQSLDAIAVVTADRRLLDLALRMRLVAIDEKTPRGLNGAAAMGTAECMARGANSVLILLSDLPLVTPKEIDALYTDLPSEPHVRLVRSHEGFGTNAILRLPPAVISTRFGGRSFEHHVAAARESGVPHTALDLPGISFDVDTTEDLQTLVRLGRSSRTFYEARKIGLLSARPV